MSSCNYILVNVPHSVVLRKSYVLLNVTVFSLFLLGTFVIKLYMSIP